MEGIMKVASYFLVLMIVGTGFMYMHPMAGSPSFYLQFLYSSFVVVVGDLALAAPRSAFGGVVLTKCRINTKP